MVGAVTRPGAEEAGAVMGVGMVVETEAGEVGGAAHTNLEDASLLVETFDPFKRRRYRLCF